MILRNAKVDWESRTKKATPTHAAMIDARRKLLIQEMQDGWNL